MEVKRGKFTAVLLGFQVLFIILFGLFVEYDTAADASNAKNSKDVAMGGADPASNTPANYYPSK